MAYLPHVILLLLLLLPGAAPASDHPLVQNPILPGFHPDPTICRAGEEYYICNSSFTWYPGLPLYCSRDLVHWEPAGHAIDRPGMIELEGVRDKDGVWAPTLRYHDGRFYLLCNVSNGGNFYLTADRAAGPWSDPVWLKDAPGIDPDLFWDEDGRSYLLANQWGIKEGPYKDKCVIWIQQIDLESGRLLGERHYLTTGHAANARSAEGAHLYRVGGRYALLVSEGGTDFYHAVTVHWSDQLFGPYRPQHTNPVLTHRHLGHGAAIQSVGHADLVQTPAGDWYAVCLAKRMTEGYTFTRETFLCPVELQQDEFIFNPGVGQLQERFALPGVPESPAAPQPAAWYYERIPHTAFDRWEGDTLLLRVQPECIDSLTAPALVMRKVTSHRYMFTATLDFRAARETEEAGIVLHRNASAYTAILKGKETLRVVRCVQGVRQELARIPWQAERVVLQFEADGVQAVFRYGPAADRLQPAANVDLRPLADDAALNRFNGLGIGCYATGNGSDSAGTAVFGSPNYEDR